MPTLASTKLGPDLTRTTVGAMSADSPKLSPKVSTPSQGAFARVVEFAESEERNHATLPAALIDLRALLTKEAVSGDVQVWLAAVDEKEDAAMRGAGCEPYRDLWQLRVDLPITDEKDLVPTRPFVDGDAENFLAVNNRAFSWHPEQGGMTLADLRSAQQEPWFDADAFRIHEHDGQIAGFNWLKVHRRETGGSFDEPMGEIYVIAVDPDFHGLGLGSGLSRAGLHHLHGMGLARAMLYVESDNEAANRVYERIGFTRHQTNRAYRMTLSS